MLSVLLQRLIHQHGLSGLNGVNNPCDPVEHQRVQQVRFRQRGYRVLQHLSQQVLHLLNP
jgi:hypothetical protein